MIRAHILRLLPVLISGFCVLLAAPTAYAACSNPSGGEAEIKYSSTQNVPMYCNGISWIPMGMLNPGAGGSGCPTSTMGTKPEGHIFYNMDYHILQYCDGDDWRGVANGSVAVGEGCAAPTDCSNVGDVCSDGSIFAGFMTDNDGSCRNIFVTDDNQSTASEWKTSTGTDDISTDDPVDGRVNHANRGGAITDFPAFDLCESSAYHGKSDWYLPARAELNLLWLNRVAINANAAGNFTTSSYWSSTEYDASYAWYQAFGNGLQNANTKTFFYGVRCVRSEPSSVAASGGLTGPAGCENIGDLCADGTVFAGWHPITHAHLFIPNTDQEQPGSPGTFTMNWKNATGTNDISTDSDNDGQINHANRGGAIGDFQAFQACEDLSFGGQSDWYLPSKVELYYIWSIRDTIEAGGNTTNFQNGFYWSSTENITNYGWSQNFSNGYQVNSNKDTAYRVRCVRR